MTSGLLNLYEIFLKVLNMSLTASAVIFFVLLARLALRKAPKVFSYVLWLAVLFRLLCPVSVTSAFSLLRLFDPPVRKMTPVTSAVEYIPSAAAPADPAQMIPPAPGVEEPVSPAAFQGEAPAIAGPAPSVEVPAAILTGIWAAGILVMLLYSALSLVRLRGRLIGAAPLKGNIYLADHISTPFVMGLLQPKIYLPSALPKAEYPYIILHERYHIRRLDHLARVLAYAALCIHWFNPSVWLAFILSGKDMEMSCDEAVLKRLGADIRADYSASLLRLAAGRRVIAGMPLAFGESDTKSRVKNLLRWKRPKLWITLAVGIVCLTVIAVCAANPQAGSVQPEDAGHSNLTGRYASMEDFAAQLLESVKSVSYYNSSGEEATADVTGARLAWLDRTGMLEGLAPNGTLESWIYNYEVRVGVDPADIMLAGGMHEQNGWYDMEGQGGHNVVALRYEDGSYDVLYDRAVNDNLDFYGYHLSYEEVLYDWYVTENGLDLPLYVTNLTTESGEILLVHRYDGYGWYIYIPIMGWSKGVRDRWDCLYRSDSYLEVTLNPDLKSHLYYDDETVPFVEYFYDAASAQEDDLETLRAMASSFTIDKRIRLDEATEHLRAALRGYSPMELESFVREDGSVRRELIYSPSFGGLFSSLADQLQGISNPDSIPVRPVAACLYGPNSNCLAFTAAEEFGQVLIRYVGGNNVNAAAVVDNSELYIFLLAVEESENAELHDLDEDGSLETLVGLSVGNRRNLIIYDAVEGELSRVNVNEALNAAASDYTGDVGNIAREYGNMVEAAGADGNVGIYRYMPDGTFTYVISLDDALRQ